MTTTRIFKSTDASAPVLTGQVGSLIALLQACLVGTAGVAYGSGGTAKTAAGWTNPYDDPANHKSAFRNSLAAGGSGCYVRILDDGSLSGSDSTFREASARAYSGMTDVNTGTDPAPSVAQLADGIILRKSATLDATARPWLLVADERTFYLNLCPGSVVLGGAATATDNIAWFGDFASEVPGDAYAYGSGGFTAPNAFNTARNGLVVTAAATPAFTYTGSSGPFAGRGYAGTGAAIGMSAGVPAAAASSNIGDSASMANPAPGSGQEYWMPYYFVAEGMIRGRARGMYAPLSKLSTIATGTIRTNIVGLPAGHALVVMRSADGGTVGPGLGIDTLLAW